MESTSQSSQIDPGAALPADVALPLDSIRAPEQLPRVLAAAEEATRVLAEVGDAYLVDSAAMYECAAADLAQVKRRQKELDELRDYIMKPLREHNERLTRVLNVPRDNLKIAEDRIKAGMVGYDQRAEAARAEAERQARAAAEKRAATVKAEADAILAAANEKRLAAEAAVEHATDFVAREQALARLEEADRAAQVATDASFAAAAAPAVVPMSTASSTPSVKGLSKRKTWKAKLRGVTDAEKAASLAQLVQAAARDPKLLALLEFNDKGGDAWAKAMKEHASAPGVDFFCTQSVGSTAAKAD
jgi:hypothetical protein